MKYKIKITNLIILTVLTLAVSCQTEYETIRKSKDLIADKKYESAFKILDKFDPKNRKTEIVLLKEKIVLNYFVSSIMHQAFALIDLKKDEELMDYRGKAGSFGMQKFEIDKILDSLIKIYPNNCELYNGLGEFYYEVHLKYGDKWLKNEECLYKLIESNFKKVISAGCADYLSYYYLGEINTEQKKYNEAIPFFLKAIELNKGYASSYYNLAYTYLFINDRENALSNAKLAFDIYTDKTYKSDAARMIGQIYSELNDDKNALAYYELANNIEPDNYYNIKPLLNLYVKTENIKAKETTKIFFNLDPTNPQIYNDLDDIFFIYNKQGDLKVFYEEQLSIFKGENKIEGSLYFYLAKIFLETDKNHSKELFLKAKETLYRVYNKEHPVFSAIEAGIKKLKNKSLLS